MGKVHHRGREFARIDGGACHHCVRTVLLGTCIGMSYVSYRNSPSLDLLQKAILAASS